jgi:hypothetical protein
MNFVKTILYEKGNISDTATQTAGSIYYWKNNLNGKGYVGQTMTIWKRMHNYIQNRFSSQRAFYPRSFYAYENRKYLTVWAY